MKLASGALLALARRAQGQTSAEYIGVLLIVSVIIATLATTDIGHAITGELSRLVQDIAGGE